MRFSGQYIYMYSISFTCTIYYTSNPPNPCPQGPTQGFRKCGAFFPCCVLPWTEIKTSCHLRNFANLSPLCVILLTTCKCTGASHFHNLSRQLSKNLFGAFLNKVLSKRFRVRSLSDPMGTDLTLAFFVSFFSFFLLFLLSSFPFSDCKPSYIFYSDKLNFSFFICSMSIIFLVL